MSEGFDLSLGWLLQHFFLLGWSSRFLQLNEKWKPSIWKEMIYLRSRRKRRRWQFDCRWSNVDQDKWSRNRERLNLSLPLSRTISLSYQNSYTKSLSHTHKNTYTYYLIQILSQAKYSFCLILFLSLIRIDILSLTHPPTHTQINRYTHTDTYA